VDARRIHPEALIGSESFSGNLEQNAFEGRGSHKGVAPALALSLTEGSRRLFARASRPRRK